MMVSCLLGALLASIALAGKFSLPVSESRRNTPERVPSNKITEQDQKVISLDKDLPRYFTFDYRSRGSLIYVSFLKNGMLCFS